MSDTHVATTIFVPGTELVITLNPGEGETPRIGAIEGSILAVPLDTDTQIGYIAWELEALILHHARHGIDVIDPRYLAGIHAAKDRLDRLEAGSFEAHDW